MSSSRAARPMIFGTDGVRDRAGEGYLTAASVTRLIGATALLLEDRERFPGDFPAGRGRTVVIGRDTRSSGRAISDQVTEAFSRGGYEVLDLGVLPTPGVAFIASAWREATLGVVISASHNPAEYNGIKFVAPTGAKISPDFEKAVSEAYWDERAPPAQLSRPGSFDRSGEAREAYVRRLVIAARKPGRLAGKKLVLDAANGAAFEVGPEVFRRLGMVVESIGVAPDGQNINRDCGALHPGALAALAREKGAALGFCFDGDADRMIPVTATGRMLDGDHVLCLAGKSFHRTGRLPGRTVVATSMSNIGLELALREDGLDLLRTDVGDRNVYLAMVAGNHPVGGEQSGHIIFLQDAQTGDGVLAALRLVDLLESETLDLESESRVMKQYPQLLKNVRVSQKLPLEGFPAIQAAVEKAEAELRGEGRIVLRYSGTEPLARVMLEGPDNATVERLVDSICEAIRHSLGDRRGDPGRSPGH